MPARNMVFRNRALAAKMAVVIRSGLLGQIGQAKHTVLVCVQAQCNLFCGLTPWAIRGPKPQNVRFFPRILPLWAISLYWPKGGIWLKYARGVRFFGSGPIPTFGPGPS